MKIEQIETREALGWDNQTCLEQGGIKGLNVGSGIDFFNSYKDGEFLYIDIDSITDPHGISSSEGEIVRVNEEYYFLQQDVTKPMPLKPESFQWIFCEHFVEHIEPYDFYLQAKECYRLLKPGGTMRISTPNLSLYMQGYLDKDKDDAFFRRHHKELLGLIGGLLTRPGDRPLNEGEMAYAAQFWRNVDPDFTLESNDRADCNKRILDTLDRVLHRPAVMVNQIFQFYGHKWIYDIEELTYWLGKAGCSESQISVCDYRQGKDEQLYQLDRDYHNDESIYIEVYK